MFAWQKLVDGRGKRWVPCPIREAYMRSGSARRDLARPLETATFWRCFFLTGVPFALLMSVGLPMLLRLAIGRSPATDLLSTNTQLQFWFYLVAFGGIMGWCFSRTVWRNASCAIATMTRAGLCPACAYRIDDCQPEADGCTVCPECGGAWRVLQGTNTEPESSS